MLGCNCCAKHLNKQILKYFYRVKEYYKWARPKILCNCIHVLLNVPEDSAQRIHTIYTLLATPKQLQTNQTNGLEQQPSLCSAGIKLVWLLKNINKLPMYIPRSDISLMVVLLSDLIIYRLLPATVDFVNLVRV